MNEIWKDVIGWENYYQISNTGYVRSKDRYMRHYQGGLALLKGKLLSPNRVKGYLVATFFKDEHRERWLIHRLVAIHFISNPENKPTVNHKNTIKNDNRADNLEWATDSEQQIHAVKNGLRDNTMGEKNNLSKVKNEDVIKMRELYATGNFFQREIADMFGLTEEHCHKIINRKAWKHVE